MRARLTVSEYHQTVTTIASSMRAPNRQPHACLNPEGQELPHTIGDWAKPPIGESVEDSLEPGEFVLSGHGILWLMGKWCQRCIAHLLPRGLLPCPSAF